MIPANILVPIDFSACAEHALDYACDLAAKLGARIHVINAIGATLPELSVALTPCCEGATGHAAGGSTSACRT